MLQSNQIATVFTAGLATAGIASLAYRIWKPQGRSRSKSNIHASPLESFLPGLSHEEHGKLPYPPSLIPGARDLPTPYGTIRVYEWGPEDARRKVLLIHGISGAAPALFGCAERLVKAGCRVMMMELFGRGWSGGPSDLPYDGRLYCTQIFMALASSPIAWTGDAAGRFSIIGYSLGGCISVEFTSWFPQFVADLVLVAPAGLIRAGDWKTALIYSGALPDSWTERMVKRRLTLNPNIVSRPDPENVSGEPEEAAATAVPKRSVSRRQTHVDSQAVVKWQIKENPAFLPAFIGSIRFSPTRGQHERWRLIGSRCDAVRKARESDDPFRSSTEEYGLDAGKVLLCVGDRDVVIKTAELVPDAKACMGEANLEIKHFEDAGHELGISKGQDIAELALDFWGEHLEALS